MNTTLTLISHPLCPYVQRAAIALTEKGIAFERIDIDLAHKPDWFLAVSPLGKTPVLLVNGQALFDSAVICEYLEDTTQPALHPADALLRAQHRGWMVFGSAVLDDIGGLYNAADEAGLLARADALRHKFAQLDATLSEGPYFSGQRFSLVDAVFGPVFRYFDVIEACTDLRLFTATPRVRAWRAALAARPSVAGAVEADYPALLQGFLRARPGALGRRLRATGSAG
jgi:glutathione S-transferase